MARRVRGFVGVICGALLIALLLVETEAFAPKAPVRPHDNPPRVAVACSLAAGAPIEQAFDDAPCARSRTAQPASIGDTATFLDGANR